jgi:hypothetical protein
MRDCHYFGPQGHQRGMVDIFRTHRAADLEALSTAHCRLILLRPQRSQLRLMLLFGYVFHISTSLVQLVRVILAPWIAFVIWSTNISHYILIDSGTPTRSYTGNQAHKWNALIIRYVLALGVASMGSRRGFTTS